jgi:transcriptional regulator with PAS, ATPase and Fis domain
MLGIEDFKSQLGLSPAKKGFLQLPEVGTITLDELEIQMIKRAMAFHRNKVSKAANALGITRSSLYRRLEKYNLPYDESQE